MESLVKPLLSSMAAESIFNFILKNKLNPGDPIPTEKTISESLSISRTSVREGIVQLKSLGLLESVQGGRVYLKEYTLSDFMKPATSLPIHLFLHLSREDELNILVLRRIIEIGSLKEALARDPKKLALRLRKHVENMSKNLKNRTEFILHDSLFHKEILTNCANPLIEIILNQISGLYRTQLYNFSELPGALERAFAFHLKIVDFIDMHKNDDAVRALEEHLFDMEQTIKSIEKK